MTFLETHLFAIAKSMKNGLEKLDLGDHSVHYYDGSFRDQMLTFNFIFGVKKIEGVIKDNGYFSIVLEDEGQSLYGDFVKECNLESVGQIIKTVILKEVA